MFNWIKDNPIFFLLIFLAIAAPSLFMGAMRALFYVILGVILLLLILGVVFKFKIRRLQKDMEEQMGAGKGANSWGGFYNSQQQRAGQQGRTNRSTSEEGEVKIFKQQGAGEKRVAKDVGDYVDFEEVKENK